MHRYMGIVVAAAWLAAPVAGLAGDRGKALEVIEKAIKAHGGADALNKAKTRSRSGEGAFTLSGEVPLATEETVAFPDRCRVVLKLQQQNRIILVLNGEKGWTQSGGETKEMTRADLKEKREDLYVWWLMNLTPLVKDEFQLKPLADAKVHDQAASVVQVSRKDYPDARLFFDNKSGLLVKIARRGTLSGLSVNFEYLYSDHKEFDGIKMPTKEVILVNGSRKFSEITFKNYKVLSHVEDKVFEKP